MSGREGSVKRKQSSKGGKHSEQRGRPAPVRSGSYSLALQGSTGQAAAPAVVAVIVGVLFRSQISRFFRRLRKKGNDRTPKRDALRGAAEARQRPGRRL
mmetsp:Transcript_15612/g.47096  ORF Transcript_15612/g.47096 Transcript_15612/m.47096 type:complete len:99 (-) Transcript_15612:758-1054(-)